MNGLDKKKLLSGAFACLLVAGGVALAEHFSLVPDVFSASGARPSLTTHPARSTPAAPGKQFAAASAAATDALININTASADELTTLSGIGPAKAAAVVNYREAHGVFYRIEDITKVSGIGQALFENIRDSITVGNVAPPPSIGAAAPVLSSSTPEESPARVVISEVMAGKSGNAGYEYVELYNAGAGPADLTGWSVKKKTSTGTLSTLVSASRLGGKTIPAGKHFLVAGSGYDGTPAADVVWPSSYTFAHSNNGLILDNAFGEAADSVAWSDIPTGKSYARVAPESATFVIADPQPENSQ